MVRSSGHHRKRSRSRSATPEHKRSKFSRDYDKDRSRRRSRSRDRLRRSRSRDRKKDKKGGSESRIRSKPLKLKRRSRSRSRSKSKDRNIKKEEKKEIKTEDEPFDPTNLDKGADKEDEDEWVVTDVIEEGACEDNGDMEEEYDYEADEDDQYSHISASHNSHQSSPNRRSRRLSEEIYDEVIKEDESLNNEDCRKDDQVNGRDDLKDDVEVVPDNKDVEKSEVSHKESENKGDEGSKLDKDTINDDKRIADCNSSHRRNIKHLSEKYDSEKLKRDHSRSWYLHKCQCSESVVRLVKEQIRQQIRLDKQFHETRVRHENSRHEAELHALKAQMRYWKQLKTD